MHLKKLKNQLTSNADDAEETSISQTSQLLQQNPKQIQHEQKLNNNNNNNAGDGEKAFNFIVMIKKGNKPQFHNLEVPVTSEFATKFKAREQVS